MWIVYWSIFGGTLWFLRYTNGQRELGDIDLGCPQGAYRYGNFCYVVSPIFVTYEDAEILCETGGGLLAPIKDLDTQTFIQKLRVRKFLHRYWFGLNDKKTEGEWLYSDNTRMSSFSKWHRGEPNNFGKNQHCVNMWLERHLEWDDEDCARKLLYICEYTDDNCTERYPNYYGRSCYELSKEFVSYDEADIICQRNGGMLATIKTEGTFNFLKTIIYAERFWLNMEDRQMQSIIRDQSNRVSWVIDAWIGTRFLNGEWMHSDGTPVIFARWAPGEPYNARNQEDCVKLGQLWNDVQCDLRHGFVCRYPVNENFKSLSSNADNTLTSDVDTEQLLPPRELESKAASSSAIYDTSNNSDVHLGVVQFVIVLIGCALIGMIAITVAFVTVVKIRQRYHSSQTLRDDQDLEILSEPEAEDYS